MKFNSSMFDIEFQETVNFYNTNQYYIGKKTSA